ncbi:MAG TPA: hypothetical protein VFL13_06600 [Candidatus Baltobacteraceae bacterium]|nr:hypothetical protein [Candidatus Baltobacteraceae bacterium]
MHILLFIALFAAFSTTNVPKHLITAIYGEGSGVVPTPDPSIAPIATQARYVNWVYTGISGGTDWIAAYNNAGVNTTTYISVWRNYSDNGVAYTDIAPGGAHAAAEATDCTGNPLTTGTVYLNDPRTGAVSLGHVNYVTHLLSSEYTALFEDNAAVIGGVEGLPCGYLYNGNFIPATNSINSQVTNSAGKTALLFVNTINGWWIDNDGPAGWVDATSLSAPANVLGLECEQCYLRHTQGISNGKLIGATWMSMENAEIAMVQKQKIFWSYANSTCAAGDTALALDQRMYEYASALLSYDPAYLMFQECFASTPSNFLIMPETQLVPEMPTVTATSSVLSYLVNGNLYARQFAACYYAGALVGPCAVLINPSATTYAIPSNIYIAYTNSVILQGTGLLDGGTLLFTGTKPASVGPYSGAVLIGH